MKRKYVICPYCDRRIYTVTVAGEAFWTRSITTNKETFVGDIDVHHYFCPHCDNDIGDVFDLDIVNNQ